MNWSKRESLFAVVLTLLVMTAISGIFGELAVSGGFLFWNFLVVALFFVAFHAFRKLTRLSTSRQFQLTVFFMSFGIRSLIMLGLYVLFYEITGTSFDVEATDAWEYHAVGVELARQIWEGKLDFFALTRGWSDQFDDMGYGIFLGLIYSIFDKSIIMARLIQCVLDSLSVILVYRITRSIWEEKIARFAAILAMLFPLQIFYVALHLKETVMIFSLLLGILAAYRLSERISAISLMLLIFSSIALASMRSALFLIFVATILSFYSFKRSKSMVHRAVTIVLFCISLVLSITYFGIDRDLYPKAKRLVGLQEDASLGGRSLGLVASRGQLMADLTSLPVLALNGVQSPYPSMVRTNIKYFNQTLQWYQIGALFVWGYLAFFGFYGLYYSMRFYFKESLLLTMMVIGYGAALVMSVYIMSIRYNIVKIVLFLPLISLGVSKFPHTRMRWWYVYVCFYTMIVMVWNYIKIYGRGYI